MEGLQCTGCGSTNVMFDAKRRILTCSQCGKEEYYSRATLNANGRVVYGKRNAINFFGDGKLDDARHYAMEVLNISMDNAPAMYILAYHDEFKNKKTGAMKDFFNSMRDVALEYDEVVDLRGLILCSAYNMLDFEEDIIELIASNMQSDEDSRELCDFIDTLCPYLISKRSSTSFLTPKLLEMYKELANHCSIPKTCFALIKSVETNPDSPYTDNSFYLKSKCSFFYDNYVKNLGSILLSMKDEAFKSKFISAYNTKCVKFEQDAGLS